MQRTTHNTHAHMGLTKSFKVKEKHFEGFIFLFACSIPSPSHLLNIYIWRIKISKIASTFSLPNPSHLLESMGPQQTCLKKTDMSQQCFKTFDLKTNVAWEGYILNVCVQRGLLLSPYELEGGAVWREVLALNRQSQAVFLTHFRSRPYPSTSIALRGFPESWGMLTYVRRLF